MKTLRLKQWSTFALAGSTTGSAIIGLCFVALVLVEGGEASPLAFALMVMMSAVFSVFFAIIPSVITAAIMIQQTQTAKRRYVLHSIAIGFAVTAVGALAYCVVDGVSLLGSWEAIRSAEFWHQYTPHLVIAAIAGILSPLVGSWAVVRISPQLFKSKTDISMH